VPTSGLSKDRLVSELKSISVIAGKGPRNSQPQRGSGSPTQIRFPLLGKRCVIAKGYREFVLASQTDGVRPSDTEGALELGVSFAERRYWKQTRSNGDSIGGMVSHPEGPRPVTKMEWLSLR